MKYRVKLIGIHWDDGKGEYDVSRLPTMRTQIVEGVDSVRDAIDLALEGLTEQYSMLISDCDRAEVQEL
jgi:hypothetical protein